MEGNSSLIALFFPQFPPTHREINTIETCPVQSGSFVIHFSRHIGHLNSAPLPWIGKRWAGVIFLGCAYCGALPSGKISGVFPITRPTSSRAYSSGATMERTSHPTWGILSMSWGSRSFMENYTQNSPKRPAIEIKKTNQKKLPINKRSQ